MIRRRLTKFGWLFAAIILTAIAARLCSQAEPQVTIHGVSLGQSRREVEMKLGSGKPSWGGFVQYSDFMVKYDRDMASTVLGDQIEYKGSTFRARIERSELDKVIGPRVSREGLDHYEKHKLIVQCAGIQHDKITMFCLGSFPKL
jgi:hypothetical protein